MALPLTQVVAPLTKVALPILSRVADDPPRYARIVAPGPAGRVVSDRAAVPALLHPVRSR